MLYSKHNEWPTLSSAVGFVKFLLLGKPLPSPKMTAAPTKHLLFGGWSSPVQLVKEAVADSTWEQSTISARHGMR